MYIILDSLKLFIIIRRYCPDPAISHISHHVSLVQWTNLFATRYKGPRFKSPGGFISETGILLLALYRYSTTEWAVIDIFYFTNYVK
jgi:hypothetical protein